MFAVDEIDTYDDSAEGPRPAAATAPHLFLLLECDRPLAGGARYALHDVDEIAIGRGETRCASRLRAGGVRRLALSLPGRSMSMRHARIFRTGAEWILEDLGSTNGSLVDGVRVASWPLRDGSVFELGHTLFSFRSALPLPSGAPSDADAASFVGRPAGVATLVPERAASLEALARVASSTIPVLLSGESGTGKELLATAIHSFSGRAGPLVAVNCGALPPALVESQLFGHTKGAFSGAVRDEAGLVRSADGGTLFLDEIGDLALGAQAALLRVLQEGEVVPVGTTRPQRVDVRIVAATHRPLRAMAERGAFRADLLARLDGFTHALSPLRERVEDLGLLVADILAALSGGCDPGPTLAVDAARALVRYGWPANIRELRHALARGLVLAKDWRIQTEHLPAEVRSALAAAAPETATAPNADAGLDATQLRAELVMLLVEHKGNISNVALATGKARMQVHRWLKRFGLDPAAFR